MSSKKFLKPSSNKSQCHQGCQKKTKTKIRSKTLIILNTIFASKKVITPTSVLKNKKRVVVLAISILITEKMEELEQVPCIWYFVTFKKQTEALLNSKSKVCAINQTFIQYLYLKIRKINIGAQEINGITLETMRQ